MSKITDPILEVQGVCKTYQTYHQDHSFLGSVRNFFYRKQITIRALQPISFSVQRGEFLGVLGPNGAGKTTTLKILTGLITPTAGQAIAFGTFNTSKRTPTYLRQIGMVMGQRAQLLADLPALDSFYLSKALYDIEDTVFHERLKDFLSILNVGEKVSVPVRKLSLGERMKMELILSMLHHPQILFLDEPTIGLDFHAAKVIREFLLRMNKEFKMTVLLTSHYSKDIEELCERVIMINHGQMVYDGPLSGVDDRIYGQRIVDITFKEARELEKFRRDAVPILQAKFHGFALAESEDSMALRFIIATKDSQEVLSFTLQNINPHALADIEFGEQELDDIFSQIYQNSMSAPS